MAVAFTVAIALTESASAGLEKNETKYVLTIIYKCVAYIRIVYNPRYMIVYLTRA
jgi:hypothetical protein